MSTPHQDQDLPRESPPTEELLARSRVDTEEAFADLYRRVAPAVYAWANLHLHEPLRSVIDPEDVVQEVACRAFENFDGFDVQRGDFRGWLFGIARNVLYQALDRLRAGGAPAPEALAELPDTATSITSRIVRDEQIAVFVQQMRELPAEDQRLLLYRGLEGLSHERVAELMNLSTDAVMQRWSRLCSRLRQRGLLADFVAA